MEGVKVKGVHLSHGVTAALVERDSQKRPSSGNHIFRSVFIEVLERSECLWAFLDLVEDDERAAFGNYLTRLKLYGGDDARDVVAKFELLLHGWVVVKVHVCDVVEVVLSELFEQPCFADLARSVEDEWLSVGFVFPLDELFHKKTFQNVLLIKDHVLIFS